MQGLRIAGTRTQAIMGIRQAVCPLDYTPKPTFLNLYVEGEKNSGSTVQRYVLRINDINHEVLWTEIHGH